MTLYKVGSSETVEEEEEEDTSVEADVYVKKVKGVDDDFITGADVSSYLSEINSGAKFYDKNGNELDEQGFFALLAAGGTNYIRVRVWNNPYDASGNYAKLAGYIDTYSVDYDVFASSYYPYWHGTISNLTSVLKNVAETYNKKVMVAETSWAFSLEDGDGHSNTVRSGSNDTDQPYDFLVQGQCTEMREVAAAVADVGDAGLGMFYWEAAWIPVEYAYDENGNLVDDIYSSNKVKWEANGSENQAWFDFNGKAIETVNLYNYIRTGTTVKPEVTSVDVSDVTVEVKDIDSISLPETVTVKYNTGDTAECAVTWNNEQLDAAVIAGIGTYTINPTNLLTNAGFEDGLNDWIVENSYFNTTDASSNSRTGSGCIHFYSGTEGVSSTASQTITVDSRHILVMVQ